MAHSPLTFPLRHFCAKQSRRLCNHFRLLSCSLDNKTRTRLSTFGHHSAIMLNSWLPALYFLCRIYFARYPIVGYSCSFLISFHTLSFSFTICLFFIYCLSLNSIINKLIFQTFSPCSTFWPSCVFFSISPLSNSHISALHITVKNPQIGSTSQFTAPTSTIYFDLIFRLFAQF